jgi:Tfp pilus assembly protein PilO
MLKLRALYTILGRLSKREKLIFYGAIFVISLTILDRLIISPVFYKIKSLNEELAEKEKSIKRNLHIVAQKDKILAEKEKYASLLGSLKSEEEEMTTILKEIENLANKSSVYLVDMKPADFKTMGTSKKYIINLNCEAQMEQIASFMYNIEDSNKLLMIEKYQVSPKSKESSVAKCNMSISKIVVQ